MLAGAFLTGLATGATCVAGCGCVVMALLLGRQRSLAANAGVVALFSLGRLLAYVLLGGAAGWLGARLSGQPWYPYVVPAGYVVTALLLLRWLASAPACDKTAATVERARHQMPVLLGFLSGMKLCAPMVLALATAVDAGSAWRGIAYFLAFFLGTSVYILPLPFAGVLTRWPFWIRVGRLAGAVVAIAYLYFGLANVNRLTRRPVAEDRAAYHALYPAAVAFERISDAGVLAVRNSDGLLGYIADTRADDGSAVGYAGPTPVIIACDTGGLVIAAVAVANHETPVFFNRVVQSGWWRRMWGAMLITLGAPIAKPDAVAGATLSQEALRATVVSAAERLRPLVDPRQEEHRADAPRLMARDVRAALPFLALALVAVVVSRVPRLQTPVARWGLWLSSILLLGVFRAEYFSIAQVGAAIRGTMPSYLRQAWYAVFFFALVSPLFWGRAYCRYLCPFGVLSEAMGRLVPVQFGLPPRFICVMRWAKFELLIAALLLAATGVDSAIERFEPFNSIFTRPQPLPYILFGATVLVVSCFVKRFWCVLFCLDGALFECIGRFRWDTSREPAKEGDPLS